MGGDRMLNVTRDSRRETTGRGRRRGDREGGADF